MPCRTRNSSTRRCWIFLCYPLVTISGFSMELFEFPFHAMGCPCELLLYAGSQKTASRVARQCIAEALRFEGKYSRYTQDSVTTRINQSAGLNKIEIDPETHKSALNKAKGCLTLHRVYSEKSGTVRGRPYRWLLNCSRSLISLPGTELS